MNSRIYIKLGQVTRQAINTQKILLKFFGKKLNKIQFLKQFLIRHGTQKIFDNCLIWKIGDIYGQSVILHMLPLSYDIKIIINIYI